MSNYTGKTMEPQAREMILNLIVRLANDKKDTAWKLGQADNCSAEQRKSLYEMRDEYETALTAFIRTVGDMTDYEQLRLFVKPWLHSRSAGEAGIASETYELIHAALGDY